MQSKRGREGSHFGQSRLWRQHCEGHKAKICEREIERGCKSACCLSPSVNTSLSLVHDANSFKLLQRYIKIKGGVGVGQQQVVTLDENGGRKDDEWPLSSLLNGSRETGSSTVMAFRLSRSLHSGKRRRLSLSRASAKKEREGIAKSQQSSESQ